MGIDIYGTSLNDEVRYANGIDVCRFSTDSQVALDTIGDWLTKYKTYPCLWDQLRPGKKKTGGPGKLMRMVLVPH